jgi:hypothetical protein
MRKQLAALTLTTLLAWPAAGADPVELVPPPPSAVDGSLPGPAGEGYRADGSGTRVYGDVEFILWWLREGRIPVSLTTSSPASMGLLGQPDTKVMYGGDRLETRHGDRFNGVRATLGYWFDDAQSLGIEGKAFFLERDSTHYRTDSNGSTLLARPYFNPDGTPASAIIAGPAPTGPRTGSFVGYTRVELFGEELNLVAPLAVGDGYRLEGLAGARFLQMRDRTDLTATGHSLPDQTTLFGLTDHYRAEDAYYGGQVGLRGEATYGRFYLKACGEVGLGANDEQIRAFGDHLVQTPLARVDLPGGLTVQASNSGNFDRIAVSLVGEVSVNLGYRLTDNLEVFVGYTFLLWDSPVRSGDQIDLVVNTNPGTPPARPAIPFKEDLFWAQGLNVGLGLSW